MIETAYLWLIRIVVALIIIAAFRVVRGPDAADRILALDLIFLLTGALVGLLSIYSNQIVYLDPVIIIVIIAFLGTIFFAQHLERSARND